MRPWVKILLGSFAALVIVMTTALVILTQTGLGIALADRISRPIIKEVVRTQLGSDVSYMPLAGRFPNLLVLQELELRQDGEVWASVDRAVLRWDAKDLLRRHVHVREIILADVDLHRIPELPEQAGETDDQPEDDESEPGKPLVVRVDTAVINRFTLGAEVLGQEYTFTLAGEARLMPSNFRTDLLIQTESKTDDLSISAYLSRRRIDLDVSLVSEEDGLISGLASAGGRMEFRAVALGPPDDLDARLAGNLATYGEVSGELGASTKSPDRLSGELRYRPGSFLPEDVRAITGDELVLQASSQYKDDQLALDIQRLAGGFGFVGGLLEADFADGIRGSISLDGEVLESVFEPYGAAFLAGSVSLDANGSKVGDDIRFDSVLSAGPGRLQIDNGSSSPDMPFAADVTLTASALELDAGPLTPLVKERADLTASVQLSADESISIPKFRAELGRTEGRRIIASGSAGLALPTEELSTDVRVTAGPKALALLAEGATFKGPLTLSAKTVGTLSALRVIANGAVPAGAYEGTAFGAGSFTAEVSGLSEEPSGYVDLIAEDDAYRAGLAFLSKGTTFEAERLNVRLGGLSINGMGRVDREDLSGSVNLTVDALGGVDVPGNNRAAGALELQASAGPQGGPVAISLEGRDIRYGPEEIERLSLTANGPRETLSFELAATDVYASGTSVPNLNSEGVVQLADTIAVTLNTLVADLRVDGSQTVRLVKPTTIRVGETIGLEPTQIDVFGTGTVEASAEIAPRRWQADVRASNLPLPLEDTTSLLEFTLDTDEPQIASLAVRLDAERDTGTYTITADGGWDGTDATTTMRLISPLSDDEALVQARLPVALTRGEALGVSVDDAGFEGSFDYEGPLAALVALAPVDEQVAAGGVVVHLTSQGAFDALQTEGDVTFRDAGVESSNIGLVINAINGGISFSVAPDGTRGRVDISAMGAEERPQSIKLLGSVARRGSESDIDLQFTADRAQLADSSELELRLTSDLTLKGSLDEMTLAGPIVINELDLTIPDISGGENAPKLTRVNVVRVDAPSPEEVQQDDEDDEAPPPPVIVNLDLTVDAAKGIFVRGRGLTAEWNADLSVRGRADDPIVVGDVALVRGELDLAGRIFRLTSGDVRFSESTELNPFVDLEAQIETGESPDTVTAILSVEGPADDLDFSFTSQPARPEEDVIALILFGRPANQLGAAEAIQLAQAVATLTGTGPFGGVFANGLRSGLGLDRLSYDPSGNALTVGKYISDDIYVTARQTFGDVGTVISVIYEVSRFFNIETTLEPDGAQKLGANYKRDY